MARTKLIPQSQRTPSLRGGIIRYYDRGRWLTRAWPRKRGKPKSLKVQNQNQWFKDTVRLLKFAPERQQRIAIDLARDTGLYPHDVMMLAAAGNLYEIVMPDGSVLPPYKPKVHKAVFQGARLQLTSTQAYSPAAFHFIAWDQAAIDTAGFFDLAAPTLLTIPTGVNVVEFTFNMLGDVEAGTTYQYAIQNAAGGDIARQWTTTNNRIWANLSTGPVAVVAGQQFRCGLAGPNASNILANAITHFSVTILDADP